LGSSGQLTSAPRPAPGVTLVGFAVGSGEEGAGAAVSSGDAEDSAGALSGAASLEGAADASVGVVGLA